MPKFLYPGTRYLGPGNPYPNGNPTSSADEIAKKHDKSYIDAKSENDILKSDWDSTKEFASDFVKHPNLQSAAGAIGLGVKTGAERVIGVQYPNMKRGGSEDEGSGKRIAMSQEISSTMDGSDPTIQATAGGGGGGAGSAGVSRSKYIFTPVPQVPEYETRTLRKTYHFFCKNDLPEYSKTVVTNGISLRMNYIQTPPVDRLRLYMSPWEEAHYREQYTEVNCDEVNVEVFNLGARGQFTTGGTSVTNANMQLQPFIAQFTDIDKHFPTTVEEAKIQDFLGKLEGSNPYNVGNTIGFQSDIPNFPARCGSRNMDIPLVVHYQHPYSFDQNTGATATSAVENHINWPNIYEYAHMENGAILANGSPTWVYNYKPKNKYLFGRNNFTRAEAYQNSSAAAQPITLMQTHNEFVMRTQHTQSSIRSSSANASAQTGSYILAQNPQPKDVRIENQFQHNATEMFKPHRMPRFMFGVMPLRNQGDKSNQEIQMEFIMRCTIKLRYKKGAPGIYNHDLTFPEPMYMYPTIQKGTYGDFGSAQNAPGVGTQVASFANYRNVFARPTVNTGPTVHIPQAVGSTVNGISPTMVTRSRSARTLKEKNEENKENIE